MLIQLGYVSTETRPLSAKQQVSLLTNAQTKNARLDVTGALVYRDDSFFQIIEGEQEVIEELFATIQADPRHKRVEKLFEAKITQREFPQWSMTFRELDDEFLKLMPEFENSPPEELSPKRLFRDLPKVRQLLHAFQNMS